jgi:hypothetical protein
MAMRDWIAGVMLVLGTLLVLAGAAVVVMKALGSAVPAGTGDPAEPTQEVHRVGPSARVFGAVRRMPAADRLIAWGIVLLVLAAIAAGAMAFNLSADAGTK